uniref:Uncharacterized protein n=1 Tax=Cacopsylla melanoneura TaxID=428564 RepID=A0A8D8Z4U8_9HEMI
MGSLSSKAMDCLGPRRPQSIILLMFDNLSSLGLCGIIHGVFIALEFIFIFCMFVMSDMIEGKTAARPSLNSFSKPIPLFSANFGFICFSSIIRLPIWFSLD